MQLEGATCLEKSIYDTCRWIETDMKPSPLATAIVSVLSGAGEELQKLRTRVEELEKAEHDAGPLLEELDQLRKKAARLDAMEIAFDECRILIQKHHPEGEQVGIPLSKLSECLREALESKPKRVNGNPVIEPGRYAMVTSCDGRVKTIVDVEYIGGQLHWAYKDLIEYLPFNGNEKLLRVGQ